MKILAIGDFHGRFPQKLETEARKADLILSIGDFFPWSLKEKFFQEAYGKPIELWEIVGKKKFRRAMMNDMKIGDSQVLARLDAIGKPVFTTIGNYDNSDVNDQYASDQWLTKWKWLRQDFLNPLLRKYDNIKRVDYSYSRFGDFIIIGAFGHSSPGNEKSAAYKRYKKKLDQLFKRFSKENKQGKVIFISHNVPYNTKLDKIRDKKADKNAFGKHYGSRLVRWAIDKYHPVLAIAGHMHENQGMQKLGTSLIVNTGAAGEGKAALIEIDEKRKRVIKVKFLG